jgi:4'-phosphopantetheinyl transferase
VVESLEHGALHVWLARPDDILRDPAASAVLAADELRAFALYRFEQDRASATAARVLLRQTLSRYVAIAPDAWCFTTATSGRLVCTLDVGAPAFSVSHTRGLVACAVAAVAEIGIDVEQSCALDYGLIDRCLAPRERAALLALPPEHRTERWLTLWTLKEAYAKATGEGLIRPPAAVAFELPASGPPYVRGDPRWFTYAWSPTSQHSAAICCALRDRSTPRLAVEWPQASQARWRDGE